MFFFTTQVITFTPPSLADYVVIEPQWMYTTISGRLLSKYPLPPPYITYDKNGCAHLQEVERILTTDDVPGDFAVNMAHECGLLIKRANDVVVPAKIAVSRPNTVWEALAKLLFSGSVIAARRLVSTGSAGISSAVFPLLQAILHELFKRDYGVQVPLWKLGVAVALSETGEAEAIVQSGPELRSVDIIVRGSDDNGRGCSDLLQLLTRMVLDVAEKLSPGSGLERKFLSPRDLAKLSAEGCIDTTSCIAYSKKNVRDALVSGKRVSSGDASVPEKVDSLLLSENEMRGRYMCVTVPQVVSLVQCVLSCICRRFSELIGLCGHWYFYAKHLCWRNSLCFPEKNGSCRFWISLFFLILLWLSCRYLSFSFSSLLRSPS